MQFYCRTGKKPETHFCYPRQLKLYTYNISNMILLSSMVCILCRIVRFLSIRTYKYNDNINIVVADLPKCCEKILDTHNIRYGMKFILDHDQFLFHIIHLSSNISINLDCHKKFSSSKIIHFYRTIKFL